VCFAHGWTLWVDEDIGQICRLANLPKEYLAV